MIFESTPKTSTSNPRYLSKLICTSIISTYTKMTSESITACEQALELLKQDVWQEQVNEREASQFDELESAIRLKPRTATNGSDVAMARQDCASNSSSFESLVVITPPRPTPLGLPALLPVATPGRKACNSIVGTMATILPKLPTSESFTSSGRAADQNFRVRHSANRLLCGCARF